jgi:hypothetical protein
VAERSLREQHYRELLEERYGPLADLEAERHGPTPARRRRARALIAHLNAAEQQLKKVIR